MISSRQLNYFVFLSLLTVLILPSYIYFFLSPQFYALIVQNTEKEARQVTRHLISMFLPQNEQLDTVAIRKKLTAHDEKLKKDFHIDKLKFFIPSGEIVFSSDSKDIGKINDKSYFSEIVARGKPYTKVVAKDRLSLEGQKMEVDVVETYVPIMRDQSFIGAFEIYYDITSAKERLSRLMGHVYFILFLISTALICVIAFSTYRARKSISERHLLEEERQKSFQTEVVFNKLLQLSLAGVSLEEILRDFIKHITSFPWIEVEPKGVVFLLEEGSGELELKAHRGLTELQAAKCARVPLGTCICGRTAVSGESIFINCIPSFHDITFDGMEPHGHHCVPILSATGDILGVFTLYTKTGIEKNPRAEEILIAAAKLLAAIIERKQTEDEKERLIRELQQSMAEINNLRGILPLCSFCKKIRNDKGYWEQVDVYIHNHSQADISHSICPQCLERHYPEMNKE